MPPFMHLSSPHQCQGRPPLGQNHGALKSHIEGTASCGDQALGQRTSRGRNDHSKGRRVRTHVDRECRYFQSVVSRPPQGLLGASAMVQSSAGGVQDMLPLFKGEPEQLFDFRQGRLQKRSVIRDKKHIMCDKAVNSPNNNKKKLTSRKNVFLITKYQNP